MSLQTDSHMEKRFLLLYRTDQMKRCWKCQDQGNSRLPCVVVQLEMLAFVKQARRFLFS